MKLNKSELARQYRDKYGMDVPTLTLAKRMYKDHPLLFTSVDAARTRLRYIEGKTGGSEHRKVAERSKYFRPEDRPRNPFSLPEPESEELVPYKLPSSFNNFILAGDFHIPNHRLEPINRMLQYAKKHKIRQLFINGDLLDNTPFTRWQAEPLDRDDVRRWFDMAEEFLRTLKKQFDSIYWLEGNHDYWYQRWLLGNAQKLYDDPYYRLEQRLHLADIGVTYIPQKHIVKAGSLNIIHGHLLFRGGGSYANAARMLYMKSKVSIIASHVHVESSHTEPDLNSKVVTTWTTGCMCTLSPDYQPYGGKACHGFAHVTVQPNKDFHVRNFRIEKGEIL